MISPKVFTTPSFRVCIFAGGRMATVQRLGDSPNETRLYDRTTIETLSDTLALIDNNSQAADNSVAAAIA